MITPTIFRSLHSATSSLLAPKGYKDLVERVDKLAAGLGDVGYVLA